MNNTPAVDAYVATLKELVALEARAEKSCAGEVAQAQAGSDEAWETS